MTLFTRPFRTSARSDAEDDYVKAFTWFANKVFAGAEWAGDFFRHVRLVAIKQPSGRNRPIQIAESIDRFLGKVLLHQYMDPLRAHFGELQSVVARAGTEKIIHFIRAHLRDGADASLLMIDFSNAFNETSRAAIRAQLADHFPALIPYFDLRYRDTTNVIFGDHRIECAEGVRQGDPWGAVLFALALHPVLQDIQQRYERQVILRAYADDLSINGCTRDLDYVAILTDLAAAAGDIGLQIRIGKSALYAENFDVGSIITSAQLSAISALPVVDPDQRLRCIPPSQGVTIVGGPIGPDEYVSLECVRLVEALAVDMENLRKIESCPQQYNLLLTKCYNMRAMHLARCVPPPLLEAAARRHDHSVGMMWARPIYGLEPVPFGASASPTLEAALRRARLPAKHGGFGLRSLHAVRDAAFLASLASAWDSFAPRTDLCRNYYSRVIPASLGALAATAAPVTHPSAHFPSEVTHTNAATRQRALARAFQASTSRAGDDWPSLVRDRPLVLLDRLATGLARSNNAQCTLTQVVDSHCFDSLLRDSFSSSMSSSDLVVAARFLSGSCTEAVSWASTIPNMPAFIIPAEEYRWMQAKHLHLPVPGRELLRTECTDARHPIDATGHHLFVCPSHRTIPHDNTRDRFRAFCASAGLKAVVEPTNCLSVQATGAATQDRPDIAVSNLDDLGRTLLLDVTTTDAGCFTNVDKHRSYESVGVAARLSEDAKCKLYEPLVDPGKQSFLPLAFELSGRWGPEATRAFQLVKKRARELRGLPPAKHGRFAGFWRRAIAVGLQRDVAQSALRIKDGALQPSPPSRMHHHAIDLGRV